MRRKLLTKLLTDFDTLNDGLRAHRYLGSDRSGGLSELHLVLDFRFLRVELSPVSGDILHQIVHGR